MRIVLSFTDLIAIYAAVVATIVAFHQLRDSLPRVRVYVQTVVPVGCHGAPSRLIQLRAVNVGSKAVFFESVPSLGDFVVLVPLTWSDSLPRQVAPGSSCQVFLDASMLADALRKNGSHGKVDLVGKYSDATGRVFRSKPFAFDVGSPHSNESADSGEHSESTPR